MEILLSIGGRINVKLWTIQGPVGLKALRSLGLAMDQPRPGQGMGPRGCG